MFSLSAMPVKFVGLLVLFAFATLWEATRLARTRGASRVSSGLHLLMGVVMLLMVPHSLWAPFHAAVPLPLTIAVMAAGVLWFAWRAVQARSGHRAHSVGCALMFTAMVWHLTAMWLMMRTMSSMGSGSMASGTGSMAPMGAATPGASPSSMAGMPGMDHSSMTGMEHAMPPAGHDVHWWLAVIGLPLMAWLLWAALGALVQAATQPEQRIRRLADFAMNFGMFWMSTGLLVPVLPCLSRLSF